MYYVSSSGQSLKDLVAPNSSQEHLAWLYYCQRNGPSYHNYSVGSGGPYLRDHNNEPVFYPAYWLPEGPLNVWQEDGGIARHLNGLPMEIRQTYADFCLYGIDPQMVSNAHLAGSPAHQAAEKSHMDITELTGLISLKFMDKTLDGMKEGAHELAHSMRAMNDALDLFHNTPKQLRHIHLPIVRQAYQSMQTDYQRTLEFIRPGAKIPRLQRMLYRTYEHYGFNMQPEQIFELETIGRAAKVLGRGIVAVDLSVAGFSIWDKYSKGKGWEKEAAIQVGKIAGAAIFASGFILGAGLFMTPLGWAVVIISTAGAVTGDYTGEWIAEKTWHAFAHRAKSSKHSAVKKEKGYHLEIEFPLRNKP